MRSGKSAELERVTRQKGILWIMGRGADLATGEGLYAAGNPAKAQQRPYFKAQKTVCEYESW
jgi:hypothetical protein